MYGCMHAGMFISLLTCAHKPRTRWESAMSPNIPRLFFIHTARLWIIITSSSLLQYTLFFFCLAGCTFDSIASAWKDLRQASQWRRRCRWMDWCQCWSRSLDPCWNSQILPSRRYWHSVPSVFIYLFIASYVLAYALAIASSPTLAYAYPAFYFLFPLAHVLRYIHT